MTQRQGGELFDVAGEQEIGGHHQCIGAKLAQSRKDRIEVALAAGVQQVHLKPKAARFLSSRGMSDGNSPMHGETGSYFLLHPAFAAMLSTV